MHNCEGLFKIKLSWTTQKFFEDILVRGLQGVDKKLKNNNYRTWSLHILSYLQGHPAISLQNVDAFIEMEDESR